MDVHRKNGALSYTDVDLSKVLGGQTKIYGRFLKSAIDTTCWRLHFLRLDIMRAGGQCSPSIIPPTMYSLYLRDEGKAEILRQMSALMGIRIPDYLVAAPAHYSHALWRTPEQVAYPRSMLNRSQNFNLQD